LLTGAGVIASPRAPVPKGAIVAAAAGIAVSGQRTPGRRGGRRAGCGRAAAERAAGRHRGVGRWVWRRTRREVRDHVLSV